MVYIGTSDGNAGPDFLVPGPAGFSVNLNPKGDLVFCMLFQVNGEGGSGKGGGPPEECSAENTVGMSRQRSEGYSDSDTKNGTIANSEISANTTTNTDTSIESRRQKAITTTTTAIPPTTAGTSTTTATTAAAATPAAARPIKPRHLVLCLNTKGEEGLFLDALMADGVPPDRLPKARKSCFLIDWWGSLMINCPDTFLEEQYLDELMADGVPQTAYRRIFRFLVG